MEILISVLIVVIGIIILIIMNFRNRKKMDEFDDFSREMQEREKRKRKVGCYFSRGNTMNETVRRTKYMTQAAVATAITAKVLMMKIEFLRKACLNKMER